MNYISSRRIGTCVCSVNAQIHAHSDLKEHMAYEHRLEKDSSRKTCAVLPESIKATLVRSRNELHAGLLRIIARVVQLLHEFVICGRLRADVRMVSVVQTSKAFLDETDLKDLLPNVSEADLGGDPAPKTAMQRVMVGIVVVAGTPADPLETETRVSSSSRNGSGSRDRRLSPFPVDPTAAYKVAGQVPDQVVAVALGELEAKTSQMCSRFSAQRVSEQ